MLALLLVHCSLGACFCSWGACSSWGMGVGGRTKSRPSAVRLSASFAGLDEAESRLAAWLSSEAIGQAHLFDGWDDSTSVDEKRRLLAQLAGMDEAYPDLSAYVGRARQLLADAAQDVSPYEGCTVEVPEGIVMETASAAFREDERAGVTAMQNAVFVLVAGGLGERLGHDGIKVELPAETITCASFLQTYISSLLALERAGGEAEPRRRLPLVIMTSADTHAKTVALLETHNYFGMAREQIYFITQANVPAIGDATGRFARASADAFAIQTKPHGHGDVHTLLYASGLLSTFADEGRTHLIFFQDTNLLAFKAIPAALGVSLRRGLALNSLTVPRAPQEAAGAICKLVRAEGPPLVINVEYNQLESLLTDSGLGGDSAGPDGNSPYPGNVNTLIFALAPYAAALQGTGGAMPEFVNPKYADAARSTFKKPTRLECMMQDFPKLLPAEAPIGFTSFDRWLSFSPVKNSIEAAIAADAQGIFGASPGAAEAAIYAANARLLRLAGARVATPLPPTLHLGLPLELRPAIALMPAFGTTVDEVMRRAEGGTEIEISARSALLLDGDIVLRSLSLDGALSVRACAGARVVVERCAVRNDGWRFEEMMASAPPRAVAIRGYAVADRASGLEIEVTAPGEYELVGSGVLKRLGS